MNITPIIEAVFALIAAIISVVVVPYIKSRTTAAQQAEIAEWVRIAVEAAEQIFDTSAGTDKKEYVCNFLTSKGFDITTDELDKLIEAAVLELHRKIYEYEVTEVTEDE